MQTFMPFDSFEESLFSLDTLRLGKQRLEAFQILKTLYGCSEGWRNHPAVKMWRGHEGMLCLYGIIACRIWKSRGNQDHLEARFSVLRYGGPIPDLGLEVEEVLGEMLKIRPRANDRVLPSWVGDERLHKSHQSNLIRKDSSFYKPKFPGIPDNLDYFWPV